MRFSLIIILTILISNCLNGQTVEVEIAQLNEKIKSYKDSILHFEKQILLLEKKEYSNQINQDKGVTVELKGGTKIKTKPHILSNDITKVSTKAKALMIGYSEGFAKVIYKDSIGWIHNSKIINRSDLNKYKSHLNEEKNKQQAKADEKQKKIERDRLISKYGEQIATKLEEGLVWIGMTEEMAKISWGLPYDINKTILKNGTVKKQYVYANNRYLYFKNGKLETIQN